MRCDEIFYRPPAGMPAILPLRYETAHNSFQMGRAVIPCRGQNSLQLIFGNQSAKILDILYPGIITRYKRSFPGRRGSSSHHLQTFLMIPIKQHPMWQNGRVFVMPAHVDAVLGKHIYRFIQFRRIPVLHDFIVRHIAVQKPPQIGIFQRHIVPEYRSPPVCHRKIAYLFKPLHLQLKSRFAGCLTTLINADGRYFIAAYMEVFALWHRFHSIPIEVEQNFVCAGIGRTEFPITLFTLAQLPVVLQDETGVSQPLHQRADVDVPFFGIAADGLHFLLADGVWRTHFGTTGIAQLVLQLPYHGIHFIPCQFVNHAIIVFRPVQMMFCIQMYGAIGYSRIIRNFHRRYLQ